MNTVEIPQYRMMPAGNRAKNRGRVFLKEER